MPVEPNRPDEATDAGARATTGPARVTERLESGVSPVRLLLVLVPVLAMIGGGTALVGLWTMPFQPAARETVLEKPRPLPPGKTDGRNPMTIFDGMPTPSVPMPSVPDAGRPASAERPSGEAQAFDPKVVAAMVAKADAEEGEKFFRMCAACHTDAKDGPNRVGPKLWGMFDRPVAAVAGFNYSNALRAKEGTWTDESLAEYLHDPRRFAPGTSMTFVGIRDNSRLANLIAYLRTRSDRPTRPPT
jgi:cytochrome c